jgi:hypothetical protein
MVQGRQRTNLELCPHAVLVHLALERHPLRLAARHPAQDQKTPAASGLLFYPQLESYRRGHVGGESKVHANSRAAAVRAYPLHHGHCGGVCTDGGLPLNAVA